MFTNNNYDRNSWLGAPLPSRGPSPHSKKTNSSFIVWFWLHLKHNIFIFLPIIITIEIYDWEPSYPPGVPPPPQKSQNLHFCAILMKFGTQHFHMLTNNNYDRNLWLGTPLLPRDPSPSLKKVKFFIYGAISLKFETKHLRMFANNNWD